MNADASSLRRGGLLYGLAAYGWWGFIPLYFKLLAHVPPMVVLAHRVLWSVLFLGLIVAVTRRWPQVRSAAANRRTLGLLAIGAALIAINWYVFIFAVARGQVMQASLGYYINPLVCVVLGLAVLGERMRPLQWAAIGVACVGVCVMATAGEAVRAPWIALTLAVSFGLYGLTRKFLQVGPVVAITIEAALLAPVALTYIATVPAGTPSAASLDTGLLALAGVITALPLLWFATAARRLALSTLGFMQYLAPSLQLGCAVALGEPLDPRRVASFALIWAALAIFTLDALRAHRGPAPLTASVELAE